MALTIVNNSKAATKVAVTPICPTVLAELATHNLNTVNQVKTLYASGYSRLQIVNAGYNSSTVYRQVGEYVKALAAEGDQVASAE